MKLPKQYIWRWRIALLMLTAWICIDGVAAITAAQIRPPQRRRRVMVSTKDKKTKEAAKVDIGESLKEIARRASRQSETKMVDFVFVIDGNTEMKAPVETIERRLTDMADVLDESVIDYRFGLIWFQNVKNTPRITVSPLQSGFDGLQASFQDIPLRFRGGVAGYGLDAIMQGLRELEFRPNAAKHFVVATNGRLQTSWKSNNAKNQVVRDVIDLCKRDKIHLNVIGISNRAQVQLADETGGKWYGIDENQIRITQPRASANQAYGIDKSVLKIEGIFKHIARHIAGTAKPAADIVFVFDSSLSMENEVEEICTGFDNMVTILEDEGLDYRFGLIRFWARAGGGESTTVVTKPPLNVNQVKAMFRLPKRGDEHLLDAVIEGVPKLKTPDGRRLVLFIVTDESTSQRLEKRYTAATAIAVCQAAKAQVNVIGGITPLGSSGAFSDAFQQRVATVTRGAHYLMPGSSIADERG